MVGREKVGLFIGIIISIAAHEALAFYCPREETLRLFSLMAVAFVASIWLYKICKTNTDFWTLIGLAVLLRGIWLFAFPVLSDDWARFVWDGRLLANGCNPFDHLPAALVAGHLPGSEVAEVSLFAALNSPNYFTIYPPILQSIFAFAAWLFPKDVYKAVVVMKAINLIFEVGTIGLLVGLCKLWGIDRKKVLLYALNPLVIAEAVGNVHHEGIVLFFLLATLYALHFRKFILAVFSFTGALITKLVPFVFMPLMLVYFGWRKGLLFCAASILLFLLAWLPFINADLASHAGSSIGLYFQSFEFNGFVYTIIRNIFQFLTGENKIKIIAPTLAFLAFLAILVYSFYQKKKTVYLPQPTANLPLKWVWTLAIYLLLSTMVHPWYILPLLGLAVFTPLRFPWLWSLMIVSTYLEYTAIPYREYPLQMFVEYAVVLGFAFWDIRRLCGTSNAHPST